MSQMIEVYLRNDTEGRRSEVIAAVVEASGQLTYEEASGVGHKELCLTFEFSSFETAVEAAKLLIARGFHVEGPSDY